MENHPGKYGSGSEETRTERQDRAAEKGVERLLDVAVAPQFRTAALRFLGPVPGLEEPRREEKLPLETTEEVMRPWEPQPGPLSRPRYLTGAFVDLSGVTSLTPGLKVFGDYPLGGFVTNCFACLARTVTVCVRFFVVDECGGRRREGDAPGILRGVSYPAYAGAAHLGRLSVETTAKIQAIVAGANTIWEQCQLSRIQFEIAVNPADRDRPFIYAFDLQDVPAEYVNKRKLPYRNPLSGRTVYLQVKHTVTFDLCPLLDGRNVTTANGTRRVTGQQKVEYGENPNILGIPPLQDLLGQLTGNDAAIARPSVAHDNLAVLELFGDAIDRIHGATCINVFVVGNFEDTGISGDEEGFGAQPGRNIFLDEAVVADEKEIILAHEFGHNLGLPHDDDEQNLMHKSSAGEKLREGGRRDQCGPAFQQALRTPGSRSGESED
jgi:hypothetical protein